MKKRDYMALALELAKKAQGRTSPNPMVGAVIVKSGEIIAKGYHHYAGAKHAEKNALVKAGAKAFGATMYVTLEPCSHYGKQPPCVEAIIEAGIKKVIVAMTDPNPLVSGKGIKILEEAGIEVETGLLEEQAKKLNEMFIKYITTEKPFVISKSAITLDGKIATKTGDSKWITDTKSREIVHQLRDRVDAILVGIGTVLADNPRLTTRLVEDGQDPIRVILDSKLRISNTAKVINQSSSAKTIIICTKLAPEERIAELKAKDNLEILQLKQKKVGPQDVLKELGRKNIMSLLVEGGSRVNASFLKDNAIDKLYYFIAPKIIGGSESIPVVAGMGIEKIKEAIEIDNLKVEMLENDILVTGYVKSSL